MSLHVVYYISRINTNVLSIVLEGCHSVKIIYTIEYSVHPRLIGKNYGNIVFERSRILRFIVKITFYTRKYIKKRYMNVSKLLLTENEPLTYIKNI